MMLLKWKVELAVALVLIGALVWSWNHQYHRGYDAAVKDRATADAKAVSAKQTANAAETATKLAMGIATERKSDVEMAPVVQRIVAAPSVRPGSGFCGPAATSKSASVSQSPEADPGSRVVRPDVDRDLRAVKLEVEEALETGRLCQAKLKLEGFMP